MVSKKTSTFYNFYKSDKKEFNDKWDQINEEAKSKDKNNE